MVSVVDVTPDVDADVVVALVSDPPSDADAETDADVDVEPALPPDPEPLAGTVPGPQLTTPPRTSPTIVRRRQRSAANPALHTIPIADDRTAEHSELIAIRRADGLAPPRSNLEAGRAPLAGSRPAVARCLRATQRFVDFDHRRVDPRSSQRLLLDLE